MPSRTAACRIPAVITLRFSKHFSGRKDMGSDGARGRGVQVGGPDTFSFRELPLMAAEVADKDPNKAIRYIPEFAIWLIVIFFMNLGYFSR
jgi:hypothetical protein